MLDTFTEDKILTAVQELTTELNRLESRVNKEGNVKMVTFKDMTVVDPTTFTATASMDPDTIIDNIKKGNIVIGYLEGGNLATYDQIFLLNQITESPEKLVSAAIPVYAASEGQASIVYLMTVFINYDIDHNSLATLSVSLF